MRYYCTYFDKNYLPQGIALYKSLVRTSEEHFRLLVLCLDEVSAEVLSKIYKDDIFIIQEFEMLEYYPELKDAKNNRPRIEYYYAMTPHLIRYCFDNYPDASEVIYIDADMYLFKSFDKNLDNYTKDHDILLVSHRTKEVNIPEGIFNVCYNLFKRTNNVFEALNWWSNKVIESTGRENGVFGDQKYLDEFPDLFFNVGIISERDFASAPWNIMDFYSSCDINSASISLISYHFAKLTIFSSKVYVPIKRTRLSKELIHDIYLPYIIELESIISNINKVKKKYRIGYTTRNLKGLILGLFLGRAFFLFRKRLIRIGFDLPFGYK